MTPHALQDLHANPRHYLALAALVLLHLVVGAALGLSVDEAHYLLYALHPALSYFDHPPLVGWLQWPLVNLGAPVWLLRLLPSLVWVATVYSAHRLALRLSAANAMAQSGAVGLWTLAVLALAPLLHVLGLGLLPDTLLMLWGILIMGQTWRLMQPHALQARGAWLLWGLLLGLAGLSKYTAIFMALASAWCLLAAHGLRVLRAPWAWLGLLLALLLVAPVALWNAQHDWISFRYQASHGVGGAWEAAQLLRFGLVQLLAFGLLLLWGLRNRWRGGVLRAFFWIPLGVLALLSGGGSSLPHWTAPAWVALAPFAGLALARYAYAHGDTRRQGRRARWLGVLVALQASACAALMGLMLSAGAPFFLQSLRTTAVGANPFADLHGWDAAGARARALAQAQGLASVSVQNWTLASRLGWYAQPLAVHVLAPGTDQFSLWAGDLPVGADTLLVDWSHLSFELPLAPQGFARCDVLDTLDVHHGSAPLARFRFYACRGWAGQAAPRNREAGL